MSIGNSGSLVTRLTFGRRRMILKITTEPARLMRAESEVHMISRAPADIAVAMPRYVGGHVEPDAVCLVTEEHEPLPSAADITDAEWVGLAAALANLHHAPVPPWAGIEPLKPITAPVVSAAADFWSQRGFADAAKAASELLLRDAGEPDEQSPTTVLEHGDCHVENIVRDAAGAFRWIDWQEAHLGDGFGDLAFLWQRAEFTGANPPRQAMTAAYASARGLPQAVDVDRALGFAELRLLFISWPPFLAYGSPQNQERMTARLPKLVAELS